MNFRGGVPKTGNVYDLRTSNTGPDLLRPGNAELYYAERQQRKALFENATEFLKQRKLMERHTRKFQTRYGVLNPFASGYSLEATARRLARQKVQEIKLQERLDNLEAVDRMKEILESNRYGR